MKFVFILLMAVTFNLSAHAQDATAPAAPAADEMATGQGTETATPVEAPKKKHSSKKNKKAKHGKHKKSKKSHSHS